MDQFLVMMEHYVTLYGPQTVSTDAGGGTSITWPTVRTASVQCMINAPMGVTKDQFGQDMLVGSATIATFDTTAQRGDRVTVTAGPTYVGIKMKVVGIKSQPGVDFLGFTPIVHLLCENAG